MQSVIAVVKPPLAVLVNQFALAFQEIRVVLGLPPHTGAVVGKGSIVWIPIGDDAAVAAEGTQVHHGNCTDRV